MRHYTKTTLASLILLSLAIPALAGGPLIIFDPATDTPYAYPGHVSMYTDNDPMFSLSGPVTNAEADARCADGMAAWTGVASATFSGSVAGDFASIGIPDINLGNVFDVINAFNGGGYHVVYDHDGSIISALAGPGVLGFSSPEWANTGTSELTESYAVMNGASVDAGDAGGFWWQGVFTHEFGHGINLAHTQTNGAVGFFGDSRGPAGCAPIGGSLFLDDLETMYPFLDPRVGGSGIAQGTVDQTDDVSALSDVYPAAGWPASHGTIAGTIYDSDGVTPVSGVNVIARNLASPWADCNSMLSGALTQGGIGPDGRYVLNGLTPGADYVVYVDGIVAGGFSTTPANPFPGPEEYYNGANESTDGDTDDVCDFTPVVPSLAGPVTADIFFNFAIVLGDDDSVEVPLPFTFSFCGGDFNSVFIGSNGFLTFGQGNTDFSESVADFLSGPTRIAALWDDLNPSTGGSVTAEEVGGNYVISFNAVPEYPAAGANTFTYTLRPNGTYSVDYGACSATDGLVGHSPGVGLATDPGEIDISAAAQPIMGAPRDAVYELFTGDFDLANASFEWDMCPDFEIVIGNATDGVCYGSTGASDGGRLITINPSTGAGTLIANTALAGISGLAINSAGEIYGSERISGAIYRIDATDGSTYFVSWPGISFLDGIAFDENDVLYGVGYDPPNYTLWTIDVASGAPTAVGPTGDIIVGLAFDPTDGQLYGSVGGFQPGVADGIYRIDKNTGAATLLGTTGFGGATPDLMFDQDGTLFGAKGGGGGANELIRINKSTGAGTAVGPIGFSAVSGLACYHEPVITAHLDIKPGSCPNPFNLKLFEFKDSGVDRKGGVMPVALVGTLDFDVDDVDVSTVRLEGVEPIKIHNPSDVATPFDSEECACTEVEGDGIKDLHMKFLSQDIARVITSGPPQSNRRLTLTGRLLDGTKFEASDCIRFVGMGGEMDLPAGPPDLVENSFGPPTPNPFNPATQISYSVASRGPVLLAIYDLRGRLVERLVQKTQAAGAYTVEWRAKGIASGVYYAKLVTDEFEDTQKLILLK